MNDAKILTTRLNREPVGLEREELELLRACEAATLEDRARVVEETEIHDDRF